LETNQLKACSREFGEKCTRFLPREERSRIAWALGPNQEKIDSAVLARTKIGEVDLVLGEPSLSWEIGEENSARPSIPPEGGQCFRKKRGGLWAKRKEMTYAGSGNANPALKTANRAERCTPKAESKEAQLRRRVREGGRHHGTEEER